MNERTHFFIKNISLTLYSRKGWYWLCVRGELETGTDCYILTQSSSDHSITSFSSWLDCSTVGHWGPKPSVDRWLSRWHLLPNWLQLQLQLELELTQAVCGTWLYNCLTSACGPMLVTEPNVVWLLVTVLVVAIVFVITTFASDCLLLSSPSVPKLCLKNPRREVDAIQPDLLLMVR